MMERVDMDRDFKRERKRKDGGAPREFVIAMLNSAGDTLRLQDRPEEYTSWITTSV